MKNFIKEGNQYKLKPQLGVSIPLIGAFLVFAIFGFIKLPESSFKWWMLGVVVILIISFLRAFFIIDMNKKEVRSRKGLLGTTITIPVDKLQGFTIHKLKQYGIIPINVSLHARYINEKGKNKEAALVQSFFTRPIQSIMNDIDEILDDEHQR